MTQDFTPQSVLVLIATLDVFPQDTIESLLEQILLPKTIIIISGKPLKVIDKLEKYESDIRLIVDPPTKSLCLGKRVVKALNHGLELINLKDYDYILKADSDIVFPPDFLKLNLASDYDLLGKGAGMLIEVQSFLRFMGGRFFESCVDDEYLLRVFMMNNAKVLPWKWIQEAYIHRRKSQNCWRRFRIGKDKVRCGDPLIWTLLTNFADILQSRNLIYLFDLIGYLQARRKKQPPYPHSREWSCFLVDRWKERGKLTSVLAYLDTLILKRNSNNCNDFRPKHVLTH